MRTRSVLIIGAGPTGLLLAGDLANAGVACTVIERRATESNLTRAFGVHARTLEELDARGLAEELIETGQTVDRLLLFGNVTVDLSGLPSRFPFQLITPQYQTERILARRARSLGAEIVTGALATGVRQDETGVDVEVRHGDGATEKLRAAYVVGADGVGSAVREAMGLAFPGGPVMRSLMLADVRLCEAPPRAVVVGATGDEFTFIAPFGDGWYRIFGWDRNDQPPDSAPVDFEHLRTVVQRSLGTDYGMHDPRWMSRFHSDERQVQHYRVGRIFLAGDAAHCHSPAGAQGMNTGLQDAANLGWKLAAVLNGTAEDRLLDSYHDERHPIGRAVLHGSGALVRAVMLRSWVERTARDLVGAAALHVGPIRRELAGRISGIGIHYPTPPGAHRLVGKRAADVPLRGGRRLYEELRPGRFVLIGSAPADERLVVAAPEDVTLPEILVRPDGYIAWASGERDLRRRSAGREEALTQWCGPHSPRKLTHSGEQP